MAGNVRELQNLLERLCLLEDGDTVRREHLPARIPREVATTVPAAFATEPATSERGYHDATLQFQCALIQRALADCQNNLGKAALHLGLSRHALPHQMAKLGLLD